MGRGYDHGGRDWRDVAMRQGRSLLEEVGWLFPRSLWRTCPCRELDFSLSYEFRPLVSRTALWLQGEVGGRHHRWGRRQREESRHIDAVERVSAGLGMREKSSSEGAEVLPCWHRWFCLPRRGGSALRTVWASCVGWGDPHPGGTQ